MVVRLSACVHVFMCSVQHSNSGNSNNNNNTLAQRASRKALMAAEAPPCRGVVICVVHCRPQQYLISRSDVCAEVYLWFFARPLSHLLFLVQALVARRVLLSKSPVDAWRCWLPHHAFWDRSCTGLYTLSSIDAGLHRRLDAYR